MWLGSRRDLCRQVQNIGRKAFKRPFRAVGLRPSKWASAYEEGYGIFLFPSGECAVPSASSAAKGYGRRRPLSSFHRRLKPLAEASALADGTGNASPWHYLPIFRPYRTSIIVFV